VGNAVAYRGVNRSKRESFHLFPPSTEMKNECRFISTPPYAFKTWCLINMRINFEGRFWYDRNTWVPSRVNWGRDTIWEWKSLFCVRGGLICDGGYDPLNEWTCLRKKWKTVTGKGNGQVQRRFSYSGNLFIKNPTWIKNTRNLFALNVVYHLNFIQWVVITFFNRYKKIIFPSELDRQWLTVGCV
jgi:hypothetical protein